MNRLAQFLDSTQKVFGLKRLVRGVRDGRPFPRIPTQPVLLSLLLGVVLRISSYLDLSEQTQRRRWQHLCGGKHHHEPPFMLAQMLILVFGLTLFTGFAELPCKLVGLGKLTAKALARQLDFALEQDLPWEQWFRCG